MLVMHRTDRVVLRVFGRDPLKMIQGLATNDIAGAAPGTSVYTGFLTPKGKLVGVARALGREDGTVWLEAERAAADNIAANLKKYVPPLFAKFEFTDELQVIELLGDGVADAARNLAHEAVLTSPFRADALDLIVGADTVNDALNQVESTRITAEEREVMRIEAGEPKWGAELTEDVIPLEAGLRHVAISETKGCYTGQEVIVRILHRGHVNRHLRHLFFTNETVPQVGAEVTNDGKVVGQITSATFSPRGQQAIALAYVRREVAVGSAVVVANQAARVMELPWAQ